MDNTQMTNEEWWVARSLPERVEDAIKGLNTLIEEHKDSMILCHREMHEMHQANISWLKHTINLLKGEFHP